MLEHSTLKERELISSKAWLRESEAMQVLLGHVSPFEEAWDLIYEQAYSMVARLRKEGLGLSVEAFLQEYGLSSKEGVAVMCLAEALLRIPDTDTAHLLIESTFDGTNWENHLGRSDSLFVNASSWGLLLTGKAVNFSVEEQNADAILGKLVRGSSEPVVRNALKAAMRLIATQFVMGETTKKALAKATDMEKKGYRFSYDMLGEGARSQAQADRYFDAYMGAIKAIGKTKKKNKDLFAAPGISIKLTALYPRYEWRHRDAVLEALLPKLRELVSAAKDAGICVAIDAEECARLDLELDVYEALYLDPEFAEYEGIGFVLQAYQKRAFYVIDYLAQLAKRMGRRMPVRLVKGAYWDTEIKVAQMDGLPTYPVFTNKAHSDVSYLACARKILDYEGCFFPQFATHNALTIASIIQYAGDADYEFQRLYGMGEKLYADVIDRVPCRIYAPIGQHKDLLAYLIRRLLENGANSSFVNVMMNQETPIKSVLEDPIAVTRTNKGKRNSMLPLPAELYGADRRNSSGFGLGYRTVTDALMDDLEAHRGLPDAPEDISAEDAAAMMETATAAFATWHTAPAELRATVLERAADMLAERQHEAMAICMSEAGKTISDAIAEIREAIDFCRYYAARAREQFGSDHILPGPTGEFNGLGLTGRGVFVCISPWNFPLAIFMGQVVAALVSGNCVVAKPAEQTPRIAAFAVRLLHEAGVPEDVLHLACGAGETVGAALVSHPAIGGVAFTGSTDVARIINRTLAERDGPIVPLIAETGGQNCMIIDSSALLEQAVDDIVISAFGSAGQRCSALRVLYVHADIADELCALLKGAMDALSVGDPWLLSTDIGPVIDAEAKQTLDAHIKRMNSSATLITSAPLHASASGHFVAPHAFRIGSIHELEREVFGPVLHVIPYKGKEIGQVIEDINSTGYGLTFGMHSRIPKSYEAIMRHIRAGNIYINRSMIGATVGVQPFGGEGLSGTGPKAGGPHYLLRFASERTTTINTAAIGGNIDLLVK